jgi:pyruvate/2-oxoglutarate dehydrogenase complex dihydrolipoamide acyltransferase (E2) component
MHNIVERPVAVNGQVEIRPIMCGLVLWSPNYRR